MPNDFGKCQFSGRIGYMNIQSSSQINAEIFNFGPELFQAVCDELLKKGTVAATESEHAANKARLQSACDAVIAQAEFDLKKDHRALWQDIWPRIVYAGTNSNKAAREIESMRALVPMFQDLDNFSPERYVFDEAEWRAFSSSLKNHSHADPSVAFKRTTPEVWKILTKDPETFPGLRFSTMIPKIKKYLAIAAHLYKDKASGGEIPLNYYMEGRKFSSDHLFGQAWVQERKDLHKVQKRFENQLGEMTALHTMMDLGLKTIKPDRVMTYLFSQLGWLQTLPATWTQEEVIQHYVHKDVIREMTVRADVFAASLDRAGFSRTHRMLDIWFVKFGQEPEKAFGLTLNLQKQAIGIRGIFDRVQQVVLPQKWWITPDVAASLWPICEFRALSKRAGRGEKDSTSSDASIRIDRRPRKSRSEVCMSREQAESIFFHQWKAGFASHPEIYPNREKGISNENKETILRKIERCEDPELAFVSVLNQQ